MCPLDGTCDDITGYNVVCLKVIKASFVYIQVVSCNVLSADVISSQTLQIHINVVNLDVGNTSIQSQVTTIQVPVKNIDDRVFTCRSALNFSLQSCIQGSISTTQRSSCRSVVRKSVCTVRTVCIQTSTGLSCIQFSLKINDVLIVSSYGCSQ